MENIEVKLDSGAVLTITPSSFEIVNSFKKAIVRSMKGLNIADNITEAELAVATSDEVEIWFFKCCERVLYNGQRVTRELFDDPTHGEKARGDYHRIYAEVVKANVALFFKSRFSVLKELAETQVSSPESKSAPEKK